MTDPVVVPMNQLSRAALVGLVDAFVLREGTDYGLNDVSLPAKRAQVMDQLERDEVRIIYDPTTESCTLILARDLP